MRLSCVHVFTVLLIRKFCVSQFHQDDYDLFHDRIELIKVNTTAAPILDLKVYKYNDTLNNKVVNLTVYLKPGVRKNLIITLAIYKKVRNIFRLIPIGVDLTIDVCEEIRRVGDRNPFGIQSAIQASNFKGCPLAPGIYYIDSWLIDNEKLPPHVPSGDYKLMVHSVIDDDIFVFDADCYGTIKKKNKKKH